VNEPFETVLTTGIFCPAVDETGVIKMRDDAETFEFVIVVLLPPRAEYPM
jgi:inorganic pyrophosphatase